MAAVEENGPLARVIDLSLARYAQAKELVEQNKTLGPRVGPIVSYAEATIKTGLEKSPVQVDSVVKAVDVRLTSVATKTSETYEAVTAAPGKLKTDTLTYMHGKLQGLRETPEEEPVEDLGVSTVLTDAKVVTAERLNTVLDSTEAYLRKYFPAVEDSELAVEGEKQQLKPVAVRALTQSKVAAKRLQEQAFSKMSDLKKRTTDVVHVDLVKYSEWLDQRTAPLKDRIYVSIEKVDNKIVKPAKETLTRRVDQVNERVITPARHRIETITLPFRDRVVRIWTSVGDTYSERVVKPRDQIVQLFREELELQKELAKQKNGTEDMTIAAGLAAVVAAARERLAKEYQVRVAPSLARFMGKAEEEEAEEEEEKSFGDADDGEEEESD